MRAISAVFFCRAPAIATTLTPGRDCSAGRCIAAPKPVPAMPTRKGRASAKSVRDDLEARQRHDDLRAQALLPQVADDRRGVVPGQHDGVVRLLGEEASLVDDRN